jgi:hypothetical protein
VQTKEGTWLSQLLDKFRIHHSFLLLCNVARYIQSTCATSGEGLYEGLDWLSTNIVKVNVTSEYVQNSLSLILD